MAAYSRMWPAAAARLAGSRMGRTPASTARAVAGVTGMVATMGRPVIAAMSGAVRAPAWFIDEDDPGGGRRVVDGSTEGEVAGAGDEQRGCSAGVAVVHDQVDVFGGGVAEGEARYDFSAV